MKMTKSKKLPFLSGNFEINCSTQNFFQTNLKKLSIKIFDFFT